MNTDTNADRLIVDRAIEALETQTHLRIKLAEYKKARVKADARRHPDAVLTIDNEQYIAEVKRWAQHVHLGALIEQVKRHPKAILVADYVNPRMAERLRDADVQFVDTAGNAFIHTHLHHIQIKGNRKPDEPVGATKRGRQKAFATTTLKVTYALLCKPELVAATYREIHQATGVALGTVAKAIDDLREAGYLVQHENERRLVRREAMLRVWVERYPAALRPKLQLGVFLAERMDWWKTFDLAPFNACWGGEIAGAHYTRDLKPVAATVYVPKANYLKLVAAAHLRKQAIPTNDVGNVELLTPFWNIREGQERFVHPILTYADLIGTGHVRNIEAARKLYEDRIAEHLGEDR